MFLLTKKKYRYVQEGNNFFPSSTFFIFYFLLWNLEVLKFNRNFFCLCPYFPYPLLSFPPLVNKNNYSFYSVKKFQKRKKKENHYFFSAPPHFFVVCGCRSKNYFCSLQFSSFNFSDVLA